MLNRGFICVDPRSVLICWEYFTSFHSWVFMHPAYLGFLMIMCYTKSTHSLTHRVLYQHAVQNLTQLLDANSLNKSRKASQKCQQNCKIAMNIKSLFPVETPNSYTDKTNIEEIFARSIYVPLFPVPPCFFTCLSIYHCLYLAQDCCWKYWVCQWVLNAYNICSETTQLPSPHSRW